MTSLVILIAGLLLLATVIIEIGLARRRTPEALNNRKRIIAWWLMLAICVPVFALGEWLLAGFVLLLILLASREFYGLFERQLRIGESFVILLAACAYLLFMVLVPGVPLLFYLLPVLLMLLSYMRFGSGQAFPAMEILVTITALATLVSIAQSPSAKAHDSGYLLLLLFFLTASNDIAQYVSGKLFGRHTLVPAASPNKTLEGAAGGLAVTALLAFFFFSRALELSWGIAILAGAMISIAGILGDIYISHYKRRAAVKDSGSLIPGHGGLLDRIDSLLLTAPVFGLTLELLG